jgi:hypothetical protein
LNGPGAPSRIFPAGSFPIIAYQTPPFPNRDTQSDGSPPVATLQLSKLRQQTRRGSLRRHQSSDQCITPEK